MAERTTWIKVDRNILEWGWYKDANTFRVFMHLLLTANVKPKKFLGVDIGRGEVATSYKAIAETLGISTKSARTAISHLETTGEVAISRHSHFSVISILNYDSYQANRQSEGKSTGNQRAIKGQQLKNIKNNKNIPSVYIPSRAEVSDYVKSNGLDADPDEIFDYYEAVGWEINGKAIKDWKAVCRKWKQYSQPEQRGAPASLEERLAAARNMTPEELYGPTWNGGGGDDKTGS